MGKQINLFKFKGKINTLTVFLCNWKPLEEQTEIKY